MAGLTADEGRQVLRILADHADAKALEPEVARLLLAVADIGDDDEFVRAVVFIGGVSALFDKALEAEEAAGAGFD